MNRKQTYNPHFKAIELYGESSRSVSLAGLGRRIISFIPFLGQATLKEIENHVDVGAVYLRGYIRDSDLPVHVRTARLRTAKSAFVEGNSYELIIVLNLRKLFKAFFAQFLA